jgi:hypothetical protein
VSGVGRNGLKPYAEVSARRTRQIAADVAALVWLVLFIVLAAHAHTVVFNLRAPAVGMVTAGNGVIQAFQEMAGMAQMIPFVGGQLVSVLQNGTQVGQSLVNAGQQQADSIAGLAAGTGWLVMLAAVLPLLVLWLPVRLRYARTAGDAVASRYVDGGPDLLALHALKRVPAARLRAVAENPAAAWRCGDTTAITALAALELTRLGLHPPQ